MAYHEDSSNNPDGNYISPDSTDREVPFHALLTDELWELLDYDPNNADEAMSVCDAEITGNLGTSIDPQLLHVSPFSAIDPGNALNIGGNVSRNSFPYAPKPINGAVRNNSSTSTCLPTRTLPNRYFDIELVSTISDDRFTRISNHIDEQYRKKPSGKPPTNTSRTQGNSRPIQSAARLTEVENPQ